MGRREREARDTEKSVRQRVMATNCNLQFYGSIGEKQKQQEQEQARSKPKQGRGRRQEQEQMKEKKRRSRGVAAAETEAATDTAAIQNKPI